MKKLLFLLIFLPAMAFAQNPTLTAITKALNSGDIETLSSHFADNVEVSFLDKEQNYTKAGAKDAIKTFLSNNKPQSYTQMHQGNSRENSDQYSIGNLTSASGSYRVYIYLKAAGSGMVIQEIRFDKA